MKWHSLSHQRSKKTAVVPDDDRVDDIEDRDGGRHVDHEDIRHDIHQDDEEGPCQEGPDLNGSMGL